MLNLLRRYQKFIYAFVTAIIVITFTFFGTYSALMQKSGKPDRVIGKGINGSATMKNEIDSLIAMINTDAQDLMVFENKGMPNLLNDGVVRKYLIQSGFLKDIFDAYSEDLRDELQERVIRFSKFRPYVHPDRVISVEKVLQQFMPAYAADYERFKNATKGVVKEVVDGELVSLLGDLYKNQGMFPPGVLRQILMFQQNQFAKKVRPDPNLNEGDLSFFYAKSLTDWFGPKFVHLFATLIHNGALYAKAQGYQVSKEEAKSSLMQTGMENLQMMEREKRISNEEFHTFFQKQIRYLGISEIEAVAAWQKVLLFKKMIKDVEEGVIVDSKLYKEFHEFASNGVKVDLYRLPKSLQLKTQEDLEKLDTYLNFVTRKTDEAMPTEFLSAKEVMRHAPELVRKRFMVKVASVTCKEIEDEVSLKTTWNWEIEDKNWETLAEKFILLGKSQQTEREKRFSYLETLDQKMRADIDNYARMRMVKENPEWIKEKLATKSASLKELKITLVGEEEILPGIKDRARLLALLETAPLQADVIGDQGREELYCYSEDGNTFYRIQICDASPDYEVLSFEDAKGSKAMRQLVERGKPAKVEQDRRVFYMQEMKKKVVMDQDVIAESRIKGVQGENLELLDKLEDQWKIEKETLSITRKMSHPLFGDELFQEGQSEWSQVLLDKDNNPYFYHISGRFVDLEPVAKAMQEGRKLLGKEALKGLMTQLLAEMKSKCEITFAKGEDGSQESVSN